jgi:phosphoglycerate kinase
MDIGPQTCLQNAEVIWRAKTIFFNGPQGVFEFPAFSVGTRSALQGTQSSSCGPSNYYIGHDGNMYLIHV